ncbi:MAG: pirin family protein [Acidimicrobiia bacterium]|nr:pirin family protein [Acidimicrobiia bacterium]
MSQSRSVAGVFEGSEPHVVGDGFPVQTFFPQLGLDAEISPFLLLDYAGPKEFSPSREPRGVSEHPHRGFETVTVVYQGEFEHRDSAGHSGSLGPGDVQWMTAASGLVHEEKHARAFSERGGTIEVVQLWVNLPRAHKMSPPRYQDIRDADIPSVALPGDAGSLRVIAGEFDGHEGPARTFSPVHLYDVRLNAGGRVEIRVEPDHQAGLLVLRGRVTVGEQDVRDRELALLAQDGDGVTLAASEPSTVLVMSGEPIREPVARYGPFVMNTREEIVQAVEDYRSGRMGRLH